MGNQLLGEENGRGNNIHAALISLLSGWWFGTLFIVDNIWDNLFPNWRTHIFQDGYCTTNQVLKATDFPIQNGDFP